MHEVLIRFSDARRAEEPGTVPVLRKSHPSDAGYDLAAWLPAPTSLYPEERLAVPTGICIMPPPGIGFRIVGRSSTYFKYGLEVSESIVDPGYQGALAIMLLNRTAHTVTIYDGMRLAQVIFFPILDVMMSAVDAFPQTDRGTRGLGSTGA